MIVELYVTMRGFSYASTWMEKFKQSAKNLFNNQKVYAGTYMKVVAINASNTTLHIHVYIVRINNMC